jgi:hypothetical protein
MLYFLVFANQTKLQKWSRTYSSSCTRFLKELDAATNSGAGSVKNLVQAKGAETTLTGYL